MYKALCLRINTRRLVLVLFFLNNTPTSAIYTLSLHDALPISRGDAPLPPRLARGALGARRRGQVLPVQERDRKSTRLNSSHTVISYAVFCSKKKKTKD